MATIRGGGWGGSELNKSKELQSRFCWSALQHLVQLFSALQLATGQWRVANVGGFAQLPINPPLLAELAVKKSDLATLYVKDHVGLFLFFSSFQTFSINSFPNVCLYQIITSLLACHCKCADNCKIVQLYLMALLEKKCLKLLLDELRPKILFWLHAELWWPHSSLCQPSIYFCLYKLYTHG